MMIEFARRIKQLTEKVEQLKKMGPGHEREIAYFSGALSECESLSYFYKEQVLSKSRDLPEAQKNEEHQTEVIHDGPNYRLD